MKVTWSEIRPIYDGPTLNTGNGPVTAEQEIIISFKRVNGNQYYECRCYMLSSDAKGMDLIIGTGFINEHHIFEVNEGACLPFLQNGNPSSSKHSNRVER